MEDDAPAGELAAALAELYRAPHGAFVATRTRLVAARKAAADKPGATRLAAARRPTLSAWAVDQLWWEAPAAFEALFTTAAALRAGEPSARTAHREGIATLRARAAALLTEGGHAATEATLRKVTQTLAALAAAGSWAPDPPGMLVEDRDPPGFEAAGVIAAPAPPAPRAPPMSRDELAAERTRQRERAAAEAAEQQRREEQRARVRAERLRLETALRTTRADVGAQERELARRREELTEAEARLAKARTAADDLAAQLAALER